MATLHDESCPPLRMEPDLETAEPPPPSDSPGIRIDDLLELEKLDDQASSVWTLVHQQIDGWGTTQAKVVATRAGVVVTYVIRRNSDNSLWAAVFDLRAGEGDWTDGDRLLLLTRVVASTVVTTVFSLQGKRGQFAKTLACVQPKTVEFFED